MDEETRKILEEIRNKNNPQGHIDSVIAGANNTEVMATAQSVLNEEQSYVDEIKAKASETIVGEQKSNQPTNNDVNIDAVLNNVLRQRVVNTMVRNAEEEKGKSR